MSRQAQQKGITLLAAGDWTHPAWFRHLNEELEQWSDGIYISRKVGPATKFLLGTEISCIFTQGGRGRRIHLLVFSPSLNVCQKIITALEKRGANLKSDGRPIIGLSCIQLCELVFGIDSRCMVIPAHAWTPWFGIYGSKGGFDSLAEAFGNYADQIFAVETGLSSDPEMNWRVDELNHRAIISFGDAHSPSKMGRELTVFVKNTSKWSFEDEFVSGKNTVDEHFTYDDIYDAIAEPFLQKNSGHLKLGYTTEYYPEEGKYHWDGHRACKVVQPPAKTRELGTTCPVCGRELTIGVEYRVEELAQHAPKAERKYLPNGTRYFDLPGRLPYIKALPLLEIVSQALGKATTSKIVERTFEPLLTSKYSEFEILFSLSIDAIRDLAGQPIATAIDQVRKGNLDIAPGFDGEYGIVKIQAVNEVEKIKDQLGLF